MARSTSSSIDLPAPPLRDVARAQLAAVASWAGVSPRIAKEVEALVIEIGGEAFDAPARAPFHGLSGINASGIPIQWCLQVHRRNRALGILCEGGSPGAPGDDRARHTLSVLRRAVSEAELGRGDHWCDVVQHHLLPALGEPWPPHWRSAIWVGVGAAGDRALVKPYFNLNSGPARERWLRVGRTLRDLGRMRSLEALCALSKRVPADSVPAGVALDVLTGGKLGRVKVYFRVPGAGAAWLERWYRAADAAGAFEWLAELMRRIPTASARPKDNAFMLSVEFHEDGLALKTDIAITKWALPTPVLTTLADDAARDVGGVRDAVSEGLAMLGAPADDLDCGIRFLGVGHEPDGERHLNVYVEPPLPRVARCPRRSGMDVRGSLDRAIGGLLSVQDRDGWWRDFDGLPVGASDAWVTAYVLAALGRVDLDSAGQVAVRGGLRALLDREPLRGGWGYNANVACDADSTSWAMLALRAHGLPVPTGAQEVLRACTSADGGMATYPPGVEGGGTWSWSSPEVTATARAAWGRAAPARWRRASKRFLRRRCGKDGLWSSFWWDTALYATWVAVALSGRMAEARCGPLTESVVATQPRTVFETALLSAILLKLDQRDRAAPYVRRLITTQKESGLWDGCAVLLLPSREADGRRAPRYVDSRGIFTTATVVHALAASACGGSRAATPAVTRVCGSCGVGGTSCRSRR